MKKSGVADLLVVMAGLLVGVVLMMMGRPPHEPEPVTSSPTMSDAYEQWEEDYSQARSTAQELRWSRDGTQLLAAMQQFGPAGRRSWAGIGDSRLRLYDRTGRQTSILPLTTGRFGPMLLLPDLRSLLTLYYRWELIDIQASRVRRRLDIPTWRATALALSPDGRMLVISRGNRLEFRDARTYGLLRYSSSLYCNNGVAFGPDGRTLIATFDRVGLPQAFDVVTGRPIHYPAWVYRVCDAEAFAFSPDGTRLAKVKNGVIELWAMQPERGGWGTGAWRIGTWHSQLLRISTVQFSPDGRLLAAGGLGRDFSPVQVFSLSPVLDAAGGLNSLAMPNHDILGRSGNLLNPALFVALVVVSALAWQRRTLPEPLGAFWVRVGLLCVGGWLINHPEKVWHGFKAAFPHFDPSGHTAFFLIPGLALCVLDAKWARVIVPLGLLYAVFMVLRGYHTPLEIILTALIFAPIVWAVLTWRRRQPVLPAEAINSPV